jgi:hypothetical protein
MASTLPFNRVKLGSSTIIDYDDFVFGSGTVNMRGNDQRVTTADGKIHIVRQWINAEASCEVFDDQESLSTAQTTQSDLLSTDQYKFIFYDGSTETIVYERGGVVVAEYSQDTMTTQVKFMLHSSKTL